MILELSIINGLLYTSQAGDQICGRLLVTCGGIFEEGERALELQCIIVILNEPTCDSGIKRYARHTLINRAGVEDILCYSTINTPLHSMRLMLSTRTNTYTLH